MTQQNMSLKEEKIFSEHYSTFCSTVTDIDNLLKYFVQERVIKSEEQDEINALVKTPEKVQRLLKHIAGPLEAGDSKGFYTMLDIMENHGVQATKDLAVSLKTVLSKDIDKSGGFKQTNVPAILQDSQSAQHSSSVKSDIEICGLTLTFVELLPCELACKFCKLPCKNPQISLCCKNRFCERHLKQTSNTLTLTQCPMCCSEKFEVSPDNQADEKIQALMVHCPNKDGGCSWVGKVNQVSEHCDSDQLGCLFQEIKCPSNCGRSLQRKDVEDHLMAECLCYCQHCKTTGDETLIANRHKEKCQNLTVPCPNGCGVTMVQVEVNGHYKVCPMEKIQCEYYSLGCKAKVLRKDKEEHIKSNVTQHLDLMKQRVLYSRSYGVFLMTVNFLIAMICLYACMGIHTQSYEMDAKCFEIQVRYRELGTKHLEMENGLNQEISELNQQLKELKTNNRMMKTNISDIYQSLKKIVTGLKLVKDRMYDYVSPKQHDSFSNTMHNDGVGAANKQQIKDVTKLKRNVNKLQNTMHNNISNLSKMIDHHHEQMTADIWLLQLNILRLLALQDNQVIPVVLVISDYSVWVKGGETWHSQVFLGARNGNQFCLSVKPAETELWVTLHLAAYSSSSSSGIFVIEVLNLIEDDNHLVGEIYFNTKPSSVSKVASGTTLIEKIVGNFKYSFPVYQKNTEYVLRDELYLRVSFYNDK